MKQFSIRSNIHDQQVKDYLSELQKKSDRELIKEFISFLDYTEESDSGRVFHPISISSCRVMLTPALNMILQEMRDRNEKENS